MLIVVARGVNNRFVHWPGKRMWQFVRIHYFRDPSLGFTMEAQIAAMRNWVADRAVVETITRTAKRDDPDGVYEFQDTSSSTWMSAIMVRASRIVSHALWMVRTADGIALSRGH